MRAATRAGPDPGTEPARAAADGQVSARPGVTTPPVPALSNTRRLLVQRCGGHPCDCAGEHEEGQIRRKSVDPGLSHPGEVPSVVDDVLRSPGMPLSPDARAFFEPRFGQDFSGVRVHTGARAAASARAIGARAYTVGHDIVVAGDMPRTPAARDGALLAHELAHVVQQRGGVRTQAKLVVGEAGSPAEAEADRAAEQVMRGPAGASVMNQAGAAHVLRRSPDDPAPAKCATTYKKAATFAELIDLVRAAESKLAAAGITTPKDQIHALRGIYYGTTWSLDFSVEKSTTRNEGFQRFTRPSMDPATSVPSDVRSILDCHLFEALQQSQDMIDPSGRQVDFGHLIIGVDARFDPSFSSNVTYPVPLPIGSFSVSLGGTGTELVTWLGDLGGGAASLALKRVGAPGTSASTVFTGSDYGGSINLEGDVAASVLATAGRSAVTTPDLKPGRRLSDALADYLLPAAAGTNWKDRSATFLSMNGGTIDASGALTNRATLIAAFAAKISTFACNYLASRVKDKHITVSAAKGAGNHVTGAAQEVATAFVDALEDSRKSGAQIEAKRFPAPTPAGSQACSAQLTAATAAGLLGL
jgi:Domain of unknown function (DUF4157)